MDTLLAALAFMHHTVESFMEHTNKPKKVRMFWSGIGVGWSLFFLIYTARGKKKEWYNNTNGK